tara:strand:+ start:746 stop:1153 length:408 start_codon:yes stop_codon:yes gene_type:complete
MIIGVGTDLVHIPRVKSLWAKQGQSFLSRCYTEPEITYIMDARDEEMLIARLAKRWAAKEAAAKAIGTGIAQGVHLSDIETRNDERGCPYLKFYGGAKSRLDEMVHGVGNFESFLSLSDDGDFAQAFVVLSVKTL